MDGWRRFFAGIWMGIGGILPGVSGGVMAVSFGLYRPMLEAVLDFFHHPVRHIRFLLPIALGGGLGVVLGAWGLNAALARYQTVTLFLFIGFIMGGIPDLLKEARQDGPFQRRWLPALAAGVLLALPLCLPGAGGPMLAQLSPLQFFACGLLEGVGTVVPGLSTSFVMIRLGWYQAFLQALSTLRAGSLALAAAGFGLSAVACMKAVKWLFDRFTGYAYYGVLGFLLVSVALVFPGFENGWMLLADLLALTLGLLGARWMACLGEKTQKEG